MTTDEITMLASGISIGISAMALLQTYWNVRDGHRDRKAVQAAEAKLQAAEEKA